MRKRQIKVIVVDISLKRKYNKAIRRGAMTEKNIISEVLVEWYP